MRVIVISVEPYLSGFLRVANKSLDIAAVVVPNEQLIKSAQIKFNENKTSLFYSYAYLEECLTELYYDYIIVAAPPWNEIETIILEDLESFKVDRNKIFRIGAIYDGSINRVKQMFNYVQKDITKYKILITGVSHAWRGTDISCYELPAVSCAMSSQDLYYDYQFAKKMFNVNGSAFKYAVIGLAPFSFQSDESIGGGGTGNEKFMLLLYYFLFKDVHHFCIDAKSIEEIFDENFLHYQYNAIPENFDLNNYNLRAIEGSIDLPKLMKARRTHKNWLTRRYPETVKEYKKIFYDYLELCKKFNVTPIVTMFPVTHIYREFFSKQVCDETFYIIKQAQKIYNFHFINKYNFDEELELKDFFDANHLNNSGARKFSTFLNNYIMNLEHNNNFK